MTTSGFGKHDSFDAFGTTGRVGKCVAVPSIDSTAMIYLEDHPT